MKNYILTVAAMFMFATSMAQNNSYVNIVSVTPTDQQDKLMYISPKDIENENDSIQKIVTGIDYISGVTFTHRVQHFMVECVASQADFSKGVTENVNLLNGAIKAMPAMPALAKVIGLALPGYYVSGVPDFVKSLYSYVFIKNLDNEPSINPPYKDVSYSNLTRETALSPSDQLYFYNPDYNYLQAITKDNRQLRAIDPQSAEHPYVLDMMFDTPFQYNGGFIHLGIELTPANDAGVESQAGNAYATRFYFPKTTSTFESATVYHSFRKGFLMNTEFNFYQGAEQSLMEQMSAIAGGDIEQAQALLDIIFNYFNFQNYTLPGFQLTYYTNDIRGTVLDSDDNPIVEDVNASNVNAELQPNGRPLISLYDETAEAYICPDGVNTLNSENAAEVNEDGSFSFSNLDHTHVYTLSASSSTCGSQEKTINFDTGLGVQPTSVLKDADNAFKNDLVCDIRMKQGNVPTAINDVTVSATPVAIDYYNVAGVRSATPFKGVNIIVKTYSDGSRTTEKMVK